jgi:hypothetical protein
MYKFLYLWLLWLILLLFSSAIQTAQTIRSGMFLIYDAIDTSLWEVNAEGLEASLWMDFDSPLLSISPYSFRVDRQSLIYFRVPPVQERGITPSELVEHDLQTGLEMSILKAHWVTLFEMPSADAILVQFTKDNEEDYCVLSLITDECGAASEDLVSFLQNPSIIWQNDLGYVLTDKTLYHFDVANMTWEILLDNAWHLARSASYFSPTNRLYIAGNFDEPESRCRSSQVMRIDLESLALELLPFELPDCLSSFDRILISPDGRYLQYDTQEVVVLELATGELVYRPFWYSDKAMWMADSQTLLFTYYEQINSSGNRISQVNILTGKIKNVYEGTAGYVWLYQVP